MLRQKNTEKRFTVNTRADVSGAQHGTESLFDTPSKFSFDQPPSSDSLQSQTASIPEDLKAKILAKREEWAIAYRDIGSADVYNALEEQLGELEKEALAINAGDFQAFKYGSDGYGHKYTKNV